MRKDGVPMKKSYKLNELDCANCARKIEDGVGKLEGVTCNVNFATSKITIEADDARFDEVVKEAARIVKKVEPDCSIVM